MKPARKNTLGWAVWVASLGLVLSGPTRAQTPEPGVIVGHVRGPGGVSVPGATVQATDVQTGQRKATWTDEEGNYSLAGLRPGTYRLEVSLVGFRTDTPEPIPVVASKTATVNVGLTLAQPESNQPEARRAEGDGARKPEIRSGPNGLRAMENLRGGGESGDASVRFSEGVGAGVQAGDSVGTEAEPSPTEVGASAANSFLLSGTSGRAETPEGDEGRMRERFRERLGEFRRGGGGGEGGGGLYGGGWGGGFGRGGGGMWMGFLGDKAQRRSQVNRVRGNISEQFSNSALDARNYPLNTPSSPRVPAYREQIRFTLGGPLVVPKLYHGKDKTSFFVHYNLERSRNPFDSYSTVPTAAERAGDFSQAVVLSGPLAGTVPTIFDPSSSPSGPRTPLPGNQIPLTRFDATAVGLLNFIPRPNLPASVQNFHLREALPSANDSVMGRVGHRISHRDNVSAFYFLHSSRSTSVSNFPALTRTASVRSQSLTLGETHTFSPHVFNNLMLNFNRERNSTLNPFAFRQNVSGELGISQDPRNGISQDPRDWGLPILSFTNFASLRDAIPSLARNQTFRASDFLILSRGHHNLRLGGELRRVQLNTLSDPDPRGTFTFSGFMTSDFSRQGLPQPGTGVDFADFLLGLPHSTSLRFGVGGNYLRSWVYNVFAQDDWRLASRWTLNLGLRYEHFQPFEENYGHLSNLQVGPSFSSVTVVTGQAPGPFPVSLIRPDSRNLSPRIGIAFRPWTQHRLVLRAGYGLFFDGSIYPRLVNDLVNQPPFARASTLLTNSKQVLTLEQGFPEIAPSVVRNTYAVDPNFRLPYGQTWNFGVEDEIARNVIFSANYVGTKGTKLDLLLGPNRFDSQNQLAIRNAQQFTYETAGGSSIYHGFELGLRRQGHRGFSIGGNYTFSKSLDDAAGLGGAGRVVAQDLDLGAERGLSDFDVRHRLTLYHTYEFPFGERHRFLNRGGALAELLDDWQLSGNATLRSGTPLTARVLGNQSANGGLGSYFAGRAEATGLPVGLPGSEQSTQHYFNTAAFTLPPPGQFGNAGRNTIPGPRSINFNMSLGRFVTFSQEKGVGADFRLEANNLFNTPSYGQLATAVDATDFGRVTSVNSMRTLNFSVRLRF